MVNPKLQLFTEENLEKEIILENLGREVKLRKYVIFGVIILVLISKFILKPFPYYYSSAVFCILFLLLLFPIATYIKKHPSFSASKIRLILFWVFALEVIVICGVLYFYIPIAVYYSAPMALVAIPIFVLYLLLIYPLLYSKKYSDVFYLLCFLLVILLAILEDKGFYLSYSNYPISEYMVRPSQLVFIPIVIGGFTFLVIRNTMDYFWGRFTELNFELRKLNEELEEKIKERTKELEEARTVLEIKVEARTKELKELAERREEIIKERTKDLQGRVNELERIHRLTVGREFKMIVLKEEIERLKEELEKYKIK